MTTSYLLSIFVPLVGLVFPAITMAFLFIYIKHDEIVWFLIICYNGNSNGIILAIKWSKYGLITELWGKKNICILNKI